MAKPANWVPTVEHFWQQSQALYSQPGRQQQLLDAQDNHGLNVNLELLAMLLAAEHAPLSDVELAQLKHRVDAFSGGHTQPLRSLRRQLSESNALPEKSRQQLKFQLLAAELTLEAEEQALLIRELQHLRHGGKSR